MNQQQVNLILENARKVESINFEELIHKVYTDNTDLDNIQLTNMSLSEFINLTKRILNQFINQFENREITLPIPYLHTHPQFGNGQVDLQIQSFFAFLNEATPNIPAAEQMLMWLMDYQIQYNLYDRSSEITKDITLKNLSQLSDKLKLVQEGLENKKKEVNNIFDELVQRAACPAFAVTS